MNFYDSKYSNTDTFQTTKWTFNKKKKKYMLWNIIICNIIRIICLKKIVWRLLVYRFNINL